MKIFRKINLIIILTIVVYLLCSSLFIKIDATTNNDDENFIYHKANFYYNISIADDEFYGELFYESLKEDKSFQKAIQGWESMHIADSPSHLLESGMISKEDFYKIIIFDLLLDGNNNQSISFLFDDIAYEREVAIFELANDLSTYADKSVNTLNSISLTDFKKFIKEFNLKKFIGDFSAEFKDYDLEFLDVLNISFDAMSNVTSAIDMIANYKAVSNMRFGLLQVLKTIAEDSSNPTDLRKAAKSFIPLFNDMYNEVLNDIAKCTTVFTETTITTVLSIVIDLAWDKMVELLINTPVGVALATVKGIRALANAAFDLDERVLLYYKIEASVIFGQATKKIIKNIEKNYVANKDIKVANLYLEAINLFQKSVLQQYDCSLDYMNHYKNTNLTNFIFKLLGKDDELANAIAKVQTSKKMIVDLFELYNNKIQTTYIASTKNYTSCIDDYHNQKEVNNDNNLQPSTPSNLSIGETDFANAIASLKKDYPHKKYWNKYNGKVSSGKLAGTSLAGDKKCKCKKACPYNCTCTCGAFTVNNSEYAWQCHGYALLLAYKIFNSNINTSSDWQKITSVNNYNYYAGDVVRTNEGHTIFIYKVENGNIYYTDCNYIGPCQINWKGEISVAKLKAKTVYVRHFKGNTLTGSKCIDEVNKLTINYNANGGTINESIIIGEKYKVTHKDGLNIRKEPNTNCNVIGAIIIGGVVTVTEKVKMSDYTWGKVVYQGKEGWIALDSRWITLSSYVYNNSYFINNNVIYNQSTNKAHEQICSYGTTVSAGLYNDETFGLYREGYDFIGWSLSPLGLEIIDQNMSFKPEDIVPTLSLGNKNITVYAIWEMKIPEVTDTTIDSIYLSKIPQKIIYDLGEEIDLSEISIIIKKVDGSYEEISENFICTPSIVRNEGLQEITVSYQGKTTKFSIIGNKSKERNNNGTALRNSTGYLMPNDNAETILNGGAYINDSLQVLCKDGDYYLCFIPWDATVASKANGVLLYLKAEDVKLSANVPDAKNYYSLNCNYIYNAIIKDDTLLYYKPDGGANVIKYNGKVIPEKQISKNEKIKVLFEVEDHYYIHTEKYSGFVKKDVVEFNASVYTIDTNLNRIEIEVNEEINISDLSVTCYLNNSSTILSDSFQVISPDITTPGEKQMLVYYDNIYKLIEVIVNEKKISSLIVETLPIKTSYVIGEEFDKTGMIVKALFNDETEIDVTENLTIDYDFSIQGNSFIELGYQGIYVYVPVIVYESPVIEILDIQGKKGENVIIPVHYLCSDKNISPSSFKLNIKYDNKKINYMGIDSSDLSIDNLLIELQNNEICIIYNGDTIIDNDIILANLIFNIVTDMENTSIDIILEDVLLTDSSNNQYNVFLEDGVVVNKVSVEISFKLSETDYFNTYSIDFGTEFIIPENIPLNDSNKFIGWSMNQNSSSAEYIPGDIIECYINYELYPVWEKLNNDDQNNEDEKGEDSQDKENDREENDDSQTKDKSFSFDKIIEYIQNIDLSTFDKKDLTITILVIALVLIILFKRRKKQS